MEIQRKIIHVDMDCFYAAIEMRDNPALVNQPIAVGGSPGKRGVLCTSNYVARKYGVKSAMSSAYAMRLCPHLLILPVNMDKYRQASALIREVFLSYTDLVEPLSLDEAYLDVSQSQQCQSSATRIAEEIRAKIFKQCQLTASAGIAPNKFLAKVASDYNKPNGQYVIPPESVSDFIKKLPVGKIFGVGKVTAAKLEKHELYTCLDLQAKSKAYLTELCGKFGARLYDICRGKDDRAVEPTRVRKSLSVETTFFTDLQSLDQCLEQLPQLYDELVRRLKKHSIEHIHKQFVKIKFHDFVSTTVETVVSRLSFGEFKQLIVTGYQRRSVPVRLMGLGVGLGHCLDEFQQQLSFLL